MPPKRCLRGPACPSMSGGLGVAGGRYGYRITVTSEKNLMPETSS